MKAKYSDWTVEYDAVVDTLYIGPKDMPPVTQIATEGGCWARVTTEGNPKVAGYMIENWSVITRRAASWRELAIDMLDARERRNNRAYGVNGP